MTLFRFLFLFLCVAQKLARDERKTIIPLLWGLIALLFFPAIDFLTQTFLVGGLFSDALVSSGATKYRFTGAALISAIAVFPVIYFNYLSSAATGWIDAYFERNLATLLSNLSLIRILFVLGVLVLVLSAAIASEINSILGLIIWLAELLLFEMVLRRFFPK